MALPIGELFMLGFRGRELPGWLREFAKRYHLGGVILFDYDCSDKKYERNVVNVAQVQELCAQIHALPSRPRVFVDQEGGKVRRLKERYGFKTLPSAKNFALLPVAERTPLLRDSFVEMKAIGIDVNLAPVIDVDYNPLSPDLGAVERSFSGDLATVDTCAAEVFAMGREIGLDLCLKHFPGCGGAKVNSHNELMDISESLNEEQVALFKKWVAKIPMVLLSHGTVRQWEPGVPVSLSPVAIQKIRSWNDAAIVVTDDLQMEGMQRIFGTREASLRAIRAGADLLCIGNNLKDEQEDADGFAQSLIQACESDAQMRRQTQGAIERMQKSKSR